MGGFGTFTHYTTVQIAKDGNFAKYVKIIRAYDGSLGMGEIKKAIDNGEVVFSFDPKNNSFIANGKDNSHRSLKAYFVKTLRELKKAGAKLMVLDGGEIDEEFSSGYERSKPEAPKNAVSSDAVLAAINAKWKLPRNYYEYLRTHAQTVSYEIEDEETCDRSEISLYGADHLLEYQNGYAWNTESGEVFEDWNPDFVVIADTEADPFCIDISREDSPVYFAEHGMGEWEFDEYCDSLEEFLKEIGAAES